MLKASIYLHVPFCVTKCAYCDFNSFAGMDHLVEKYVTAVIKEIQCSPYKNEVVPTIFFGGGTPTFLSGEQLARILKTIQDNFELEVNCEITSEANPGTVTLEKLSIMRQAGFNRLSIGVQSFDDVELRSLDRIHKGADAENAIKYARQAGFENINLDLIFGLPEQTESRWQSNLKRAFELKTEHLSLYNLIVEPNTPFYKMYKQGQLKLPHEDAEMRMFEYAISECQKAGYERYEISNYCQPGLECRHNIIYWKNEQYIGFGPGAVSYINSRRWTNIKHPSRYNQAVITGSHLACQEETLNKISSLGETIMLGLRMLKGVSLTDLSKRYDINVQEYYSDVISKSVNGGLMRFDGNYISLTDHGLMFASEVSMGFLAEPAGV